jgi:hypothetical protein
LQVSAQRKEKTVFDVVPSVGFINGSGAVSGLVDITAMIRKSDWAFGLGSGIDYYRVRTVPVYLAARRYLKNAPAFFYGSAGYTIAAPLETQYLHPGTYWMNSGRSSFSNGLNGDAGIGYSFAPKKKHGLEIALGYSVKTLNESYTEYIFRDFPPYTRELTEHSFHYTFSRAVVRIALRL